jgi:hypothetical protein
MRKVGYWPHFHGVFKTTDRLFFVVFSPSLVVENRICFEASQRHIDELLDACNADQATRQEWTKPISGHNSNMPGFVTSFERARHQLATENTSPSDASASPVEEQNTDNRVAAFLRDNPRASSQEIADTIGRSNQRVRTTLAWRENRQRLKEQGQKPTVHTRPLTPAILAALDAKADDPADIAAELEEQEMQERARPDDLAGTGPIEVLKRRYLEGADADERARFYRLSPADQEHELRAWQWTGKRLAD